MQMGDVSVVGNTDRLMATAAVFCLLLAGCSGSEAKRDLPKASVSGTVTYSGSSLPQGKVLFQHETGEMTVAAFSADGKYTAQVPVGPNKVMIQSQTSNQTEQPEEGGPRGMEVFTSHIPERYSSFDSSGLELQVREGANPFDITLGEQ